MHIKELLITLNCVYINIGDAHKGIKFLHYEVCIFNFPSSTKCYDSCTGIIKPLVLRPHQCITIKCYCSPAICTSGRIVKDAYRTILTHRYHFHNLSLWKLLNQFFIMNNLYGMRKKIIHCNKSFQFHSFLLWFCNVKSAHWKSLLPEQMAIMWGLIKPVC